MYSTVAVGGVLIGTCISIPHDLRPKGILAICIYNVVSVFLSVNILLSVETHLRSFSPPPPSISAHCFISVTGAYLLPSMWRLHAGLPRFGSHGRGLHLHVGAGCQYWKLLDDSGTQLPFERQVLIGAYSICQFVFPFRSFCSR